MAKKFLNVEIREDMTKYNPLTQKRYLDVPYMEDIFWEACPNGAINCDMPILSPAEPAPTYNCVCEVITDISNPASRRVKVTGQAGPGNLEASANPFTSAQTNAVRIALEMLGIRPSTLTPAEFEKYVTELESQGTNPEAKADEAKVDEPKTVANASTPTQAPVQEQPTQRFRRTKEEIAAGLTPEQAMAARKAAEQQAVSSEKTMENNPEQETPTEESPIGNESPQENSPEEKKDEEATESAPVISEDEAPVETKAATFSSREEAEAVVCGWKNLKGKRIGEIIAAKDKDVVCANFIKFCQNTYTQNSPLEREISAIKYLLD